MILQPNTKNVEIGKTLRCFSPFGEFKSVDFWVEFLQNLKGKSVGATSVFIESIEDLRLIEDELTGPTGTYSDYQNQQNPISDHRLQVLLPICLKPGASLSDDDQELLLDLNNLGFTKTHHKLWLKLSISTGAEIIKDLYNVWTFRLLTRIFIATKEKPDEIHSYALPSFPFHLSGGDFPKTEELRSHQHMSGEFLKSFMAAHGNSGMSSDIDPIKWFYKNLIDKHNASLSQLLEKMTLESLKSHVSFFPNEKV